MKKPPSSLAEAIVVQWEFERENFHLVCGVRSAPASAYEVATVPLWDGGHTAVETFDNPRAALTRHAAIVSDLREAGWAVAAYTA